MSPPDPVDIYLRMDPVVLAGTFLSGRVLLHALWPAVVFLALTVLAGRLFCGWICPLGTCVDLADRGLSKRRAAPLKRSTRAGLRRGKFHVLALILGAGALGVSLVFLAAPIPLVTRFFGLLLLPVAEAAAWLGLDTLRPLAASLDWDTLYYLDISYSRFGTQLFLLAMAGVVFLPGLLAPRFWCRYLCPAGAVFSLFSKKTAIRRRVSDDCIECGLCQKRCPMNAIPSDPHQTRNDECIACETCERICPAAAISFPFAGKKAATTDTIPPQPEKQPGRARRPIAAEPVMPRRTFLYTGAAGMGAALLAYADIASPLVPEGKGAPEERHTLRPPGALPEPDFLARCVRCGECMAACPTNTIQPVWFAAGLAGMFSPVLEPTRGPCETTCNLCGHVCPTAALRPLPLAEKQHAKLGTARILRHKCLAWEEQRQCVVCDEVCPYDAILLERVADNPVAVPFVNEQRCAGCGFCEHHCPVRAERAIIVQPAGAVRLASGSYKDENAALGLDIDLNRPTGEFRQTPQDGYSGSSQSSPSAAGDDMPPGFSDPGASATPRSATPYRGPKRTESSKRPDTDGNLPPGFSEPDS